MNKTQPTVTSPRALTRENRLNSYLIYLEDIVVEFDGFRALDIDLFGLHFNELRVVIGPNGAGKTTLCDVISGKTPRPVAASSGKGSSSRTSRTPKWRDWELDASSRHRPCLTA